MTLNEARWSRQSSKCLARQAIDNFEALYDWQEKSEPQQKSAQARVPNKWS
jgi:predicted transcriptional regulator